MANVILHRRALELRKLGRSYSQIKAELGLSKSTLSLWLRQYPLSKDKIRLLRDVNEVRIERYRQTMQRKRDAKLLDYYNEGKNLLLPFSKKELFIAGLFLYWGEGGKTLKHTVSINNTDPAVIKFAIYWMVESLNIPKEKIQVYLHLYSDMVSEQETEYWSKELNMPKQQFAKPYVKESKRADLDQKGFGHGTCGVRVYNTVIKEKILMTIQAVADYSDSKSMEF